MLKLFYITNSPAVAKICEKAGVDRVFVDMEYIGKEKRQGGLNTVQNHHTVDDVRNIRAVLNKSQLLVRVNPIYDGSSSEINSVIDAGADVIMLPMWKSCEDVKQFIDIVNGRARTMLLLETDEARLCLDEALRLDGIDEVYIGLNDLHLSQHKKFMFELFTDGTVDEIASKLKTENISFGIGGVGRVGQNNLLPAENVVAEHYRLGSSMVILARAFCDWTKLGLDEFEKEITDGISQNREFEKELTLKPAEYFEKMHSQTGKIINRILEEK